MSFLGAKKPSGTQSYDATSSPAVRTIDTVSGNDSAGIVQWDKPPVDASAPTAPTTANPELDAAAALERKAKSRSSTFLSLLGDTSGKSVSRKTLLGS
jgi:hypothetical protein